MEDPARLVLTLDDPAAADPARTGTKAAHLARLSRAGFPVPPGVIVLPEAQAEPHAALGELSGLLETTAAARFAVRSSARAEDLAGASFAGQYETELDVPRDDVAAAIQRIVDSEANVRVRAYRAARGDAATAAGGVAVLIQAMVPADTAGVAFTADPVTGRRDEVVISAVRGLGERLVSGEAIPERWRVRGDDARREAGVDGVIDARQARTVAALARRVEGAFAVPQDIEWAIADGELFLLQARPMTALPEPVEWTAPFTAWWLRNLRLGELLPEPVTPLFADWLLHLLEEGHARATREDIGISVEPASAIINGWYFTTPQGRDTPARLILRLVRRPRALRHMLDLLIQPFRDPPAADAFLSALADRWRGERQPRYASAVAGAEREVDRMLVDDLFAAVDRIGELAGEVHWSVESVAGAAWKIESAFARFVRARLPDLRESPQQMLIGLPGTEPTLEPHAVESVDWYWPTAGDRGAPAPVADPDVTVRHSRLEEDGEAVVRSCRMALRDRPRDLTRFDLLLRLARKYAVLREQQTRAFTIGWPVLRRAVLRLGSMAVSRGTIERPDDAFFLTRSELRTTAEGFDKDRRSEVARRRTAWEQSRRLVPPLEIGKPPAVARGPIAGAVAAARSAAPRREDVLLGHPASPGRATGRVRIVQGAEDFDRFVRGEVLVARATAPAWTPLFSRAAAVVTDGGSLAAHASLVAREFGIPAVVATGDATRRLRDGQMVTVDGSAGFVEVVERQPTTGSSERSSTL